MFSSISHHLKNNSKELARFVGIAFSIIVLLFILVFIFLQCKSKPTLLPKTEMDSLKQRRSLTKRNSYTKTETKLNKKVNRSESKQTLKKQKACISESKLTLKKKA